MIVSTVRWTRLRMHSPSVGSLGPRGHSTSIGRLRPRRRCSAIGRLRTRALSAVANIILICRFSSVRRVRPGAHSPSHLSHWDSLSSPLLATRGAMFNCAGYGAVIRIVVSTGCRRIIAVRLVGVHVRKRRYCIRICGAAGEVWSGIVG
jgi:hypothetical protein